MLPRLADGSMGMLIRFSLSFSRLIRNYEKAITLPVRGATRHPWLFLISTAVSIHAPRGGSDRNIWRSKILKHQILALFFLYFPMITDKGWIF